MPHSIRISEQIFVIAELDIACCVQRKSDRALLGLQRDAAVFQAQQLAGNFPAALGIGPDEVGVPGVFIDMILV